MLVARICLEILRTLFPQHQDKIPFTGNQRVRVALQGCVEVVAETKGPTEEQQGVQEGVHSTPLHKSKAVTHKISHCMTKFFSKQLKNLSSLR